MEKTVSEAIEFRRSVRKFDPSKEIDTKIVKKCIKNGVLAPNSSNLQLWEFYHITNKELLTNISRICFNQPAASTAKQIVITIVRKDLWKLRANQNIDFVNLNKKKLSTKQYDQTKKYYTKAMPLVYKDFLGILGFSKYIFAYIIGIFKVMYRQLRSSDTRIVAHKSAALASQNFMISMSGFGYDTCPMEGFDEKRVKQALKLPRGVEINMIISVGLGTEPGIWGPRMRVPNEEVIFTH